MLQRHEQRQTQTQRIDPKMIVANAVLQLTAAELSQRILTEIEDNPALASVDDGYCDGNCLDPASCPYCRERRAAERGVDAFAPMEREPESESFSEPLAVEDDELDILSNIQAEVSLEDHLLQQARPVLSPEEALACEYIVSSLDDRGWLADTVPGIARALGCGESLVLRVLQVVQSLDPPGVAARNLQECLLIQIRYLLEEAPEGPKAQLQRLAEAMLRTQIDDIGARRYGKLARAHHVSPAVAKKAVDYIARYLNPCPAGQYYPQWDARPATSGAVRPDVIVTRTEYGYDVEVGGAESTMAAVHPSWRDAYAAVKMGSRSYTDEQRRQVTEYVERAQTFLENIDHRRKTLLAVTRSIIERQHGFAATGSRGFLRPLTRTQIAERLNVHESTVSRAIANKYLQMPNLDVLPYTVFFNPSLSIKDALLKLIQGEDAENPLSDTQLADKLREQGLIVSRRTVVKYREAQNILSSHLRRREPSGLMK